MALKTVHELVEALQGTSLLDETQLQELNLQFTKQFPDAIEASKEMIRRRWLTMYQAKMVLVGKVKNLFLGQYILLDLLGEGGMGQVYKARHRRLDRIDALKVIRPIHVQSADALRRFLREARAAARLSHPNIVAIHDADDENGAHFLAMEFVPGADLASIVRKNGPLPWETACEYLRQAAVGLQHAQQRGMVHRDIKPANLLLTSDKSLVKILDMGLARLQEIDDRQQSVNELTQTGIVMGTPDYMAPEQAIDSRNVDSRADIYSLGCSLYFLLSGKPPFPQGSLTQKLMWHQQRDPEPLSKHQVDIPHALAVVLERMMAKKPENRYQTAGEVAQALASFACLPDGVATDNAAGSRSDGTLRISKLKSDTRVPAGHSPAAKTKAGDLSLQTIGSSEAPSASDVDDDTIARTSPSPYKTPKPAGPPPLPPQNLDRTEKVSISKPTIEASSAIEHETEDEDDDSVESSGFWGNTLSSIVSVMVVVVLTSGVGWYMNLPSGAGSIPSNAGGTSQANTGAERVGIRNDGRVGPANDDRGGTNPIDDERDQFKPLFVYNYHERGVNGVAFSNDGTRAVSCGSDNRVIVWRLDSDSRQQVLEGFPDNVFTVDWAPFKEVVLTGGKSVTGTENKSVKLYDVTEGQNPRQRSLTPVKMTVTSAAFSPDGKLAVLGGGVQKRALLQIWDVQSESLLFEPSGHEDIVTKVVFSPQGDVAASSSLDGSIRIWDVKKGTEIRAIKELSSPARSLSFSLDGNTLYAGREDNVIQIWDWKKGKEDGLLTGHSKAVLALVLAPNGKQLISGSGDKSVRIWDLLKKKELHKWEAHDDIVTGVAIQPGGAKLLTSSRDGSVKLWAMPK